MNETHIHIHTDKQATNGDKVQRKAKPLGSSEKRSQAVKGAKIALNYHAKEMFKGSSSFLKHASLTLLYLLKLLGFALQNHSKGYNKKFFNENVKKQKNDMLKW